MITFQYPKLGDPVFADLRAEADISFDGADLFVKAGRIIGYVHNLFTHGGDNVPSSFDALTILREAKRGERFRCVEYSIAAVGLLWAYGIPARVAGLKTADVETREYGAGHVVAEFWSTADREWIMADVQWGVIPLLDGRKLSAYEFGTALAADKPVSFDAAGHARFKPGQTQEYIDWIREYLCFYDTDLQIMHQAPYTDLAGERKLMLVQKDVKPPEMFQGLFKMNLVYTTEPAEFYQAYN